MGSGVGNTGCGVGGRVSSGVIMKTGGNVGAGVG